MPADRFSFSRLMLLRALSVRRARAAVAIASIMVGAAVVTAMTSLYFDISIKMSEELRAYGANFYVGPKADGPGLDQDTYDRLITNIPDRQLTGASPFLYGVVRLDLGNAVMAGVDFSGLRQIYPYWQVDGSWISVAFDDRNAMIGRGLADKMALQLGSDVTVQNKETGFKTTLRVKGIFESGGSEDEQIFVTMALARQVMSAPDRVDLAMLSIVAQGADADRLADEINVGFPDADARPIRKISQSDGVILNKITGFMALVALLILAITTLCVNAILSAMVQERTPEIGLEKALGADDRRIMMQFLAEILLIALIGTALGLILGFGLSQVLGQTVFNAWVTLRPLVVPLTAVISVLAATLAGIIPIRRTTRIDPARVLRGE